MRKIATVIVLAASMILLGLYTADATSAPIVPMKLDSSFGVGGSALTDVAGADWEDEPYTVIALPDGKLATPGKAYNAATGNFDFAIMRYNPNGSLDSTFDNDGIALTDVGRTYDEAQGLIRQPDDKLVAAGLARLGGAGDFALVRYNLDGSIDTSFGTNGRVRTDFFGFDDMALGLVLQADGKLVAGGYAIHPYSGYDFAMARYNTDGTLDQSYGIGGISTSDFFGSSTDWAFRLAIQPDGKVVAVGATLNTISNNYDFAIARYDTSGQLDPTFASYGKPGAGATDFSGGTDYALTLLIQPDGGILVGGLAYSPSNGSNDQALARYLPDGTLDETFATYGKKGVVTTDFFGDYDQILALGVQPDGKILAAGHAKHPVRHFEFALSRYNSDGTRDTSFGYGGLLSTDFFGGPDGVHGMILQEDGKAVVTGDAYNPHTNGDDFVLSRYRVADPDWIGGVVSNLAEGAFNTPSSRVTILAYLDQVEAAVIAGQRTNAISLMNQLRAHANGCPPAPDPDDWIVDCVAQTKVRVLIDEVTNNLVSP
jgi:uncharacterized delta-60 repeat protein